MALDLKTKNIMHENMLMYLVKTQEFREDLINGKLTEEKLQTMGIKAIAMTDTILFTIIR